MKNVLGFIGIVLVTTIGFAFISDTDECTAAYFNREGYVLTITMYDSTGKADARREMTVGEVQMVGDTLFTNVTLISSSGEGKPDRKQMKFRCIHNMYSMDGRSILTAMNAQVPLNFVRFTEMNLDMPQYALKLRVNDTLPDSDVRLAFHIRQSLGMKLPSSRITAIYRNRKCTALDTLHIGELSCFTYVIESDIESNVVAAREGVNTVGRSKEWFSPQYGIIRTEYYENSRLIRYEVATKITVPQ
jgi:hypothetical protein